MLLQLLLGLSVLPTMVLTQTYYMNFIFNNNRYMYDRASEEGDATENMLEIGREVTSVEHSQSRDTSHEHEHTTTMKPPPIIAWETESINTDEIVEDPDLSLWIWPTKTPQRKSTKKKRQRLTTTSEKTTSITQSEGEADGEDGALEITTEERGEKATDQATGSNQEEFTTEKAKPKWHTVVPHPDDFFDYPLAKCHEEMDLHEVFGIRLERDRGLPAKVYCNFSNSWQGPWLLMNRMELPARLHMRHWFFGYVTDDFKDMNINFLGLAHLINNMRMAMLILGQDNENRLVYNLYDDVVISSFNDIFMLRKAHLTEANTTDLLFISVGDILESYSGLNRTCPFKVLGSWWGHNIWNHEHDFCVFPVDRDINRPGYMAIFIKPSPFLINNTALYDHPITTRRPWVPTKNANLLARANNDSRLYRKLVQREFNLNKWKVQEEIERRIHIYPDIEKNRAKEAQN